MAGGSSTSEDLCRCCGCYCQLPNDSGDRVLMPETVYAKVTGYANCGGTANSLNVFVTGVDFTRYSGTFALDRLTGSSPLENCCNTYYHRYTEAETYCPGTTPGASASVLALTCTGDFSLCASCRGNVAADAGQAANRVYAVYLFDCCPLPPGGGIFTPVTRDFVQGATTYGSPPLDANSQISWRFKVFSCDPFCARMEWFYRGSTGLCGQYISGHFAWNGEGAPWQPGAIPPYDAIAGPGPTPPCGDLILRVDFSGSTGDTCTDLIAAAEEEEEAVEGARPVASAARAPLPLVEQMPCPKRGDQLQPARSCCDQGGSVWACEEYGRVTLTEQRGVSLENCRDCELRPRTEPSPDPSE